MEWNTVYANMFSGGVAPQFMPAAVVNNLATTPLFQFSGASGLPPVQLYSQTKFVLPSMREGAFNNIKVPKWISSTWNAIKSTASSVYGAAATTISGFAGKMISNARKYLGYNEADGSCSLFGGSKSRAWCALFVSYVARECGVSNFNFARVDDILSWGRHNNRFHKSAKPGDAIIFKGAGASHTGIVTKVENGKVYTIEGNTSNKVAERSYSLNDARITGYVTIA